MYRKYIKEVLEDLQNCRSNGGLEKSQYYQAIASAQKIIHCQSPEFGKVINRLPHLQWIKTCFSVSR
jgi:hypothetical protein